MKHLRKFNDIQDCDNNRNVNVAPFVYFITDGTVDSNDVYINNFTNTASDKYFLTEYTVLEYINSTATGGQHINLGCQLMENTDPVRLDIKFKIDGRGNDVGNGIRAHLLSSNIEISPYPGFLIRYTDETIEVCTKWEFNNSVSYSFNGVTSYFPPNYCSPDAVNAIGEGVSTTPITETIEETFIFNNIPDSQLSDTTTMLFCGLNGNNEPFRHVNAKIYYLKITKGNIVVRDLIPVRRISDSKIGLYDKKYGVFYESQSPYPFEAGPEKAAKLFDILYSDNDGNLLYTSEILPATDGKIPIALCIAPQNFFGIGEKARWMSLKYMNFNSPDIGATTIQNIKLCGNSEDVSYLDSHISTYSGTNEWWGNFTADWITSTSTKIPILVDNNGNWNLSELGTVNIYESTDIIGKNNTALLLQHATGQENWKTDVSITNDINDHKYPVIYCCVRYHTLGTSAGDWYLGASGENAIMIHYTPEINAILQQISEIYPNHCMTQIATGSQVYWTSTLVNATNGIHFADIFFNSNGNNAGIGYSSQGNTPQYAAIALLQY